MKIVYDDSFATLAAADAQAVATGSILVIRNDHTIASNVTLNAKLVQMSGATITLTSNAILTIANTFSADPYRCFICDHSGSAELGTFELTSYPDFSDRSVVIDPRWFGADPQAPDNSLAFNCGMWLASRINLAFYIPTGVFSITSTIQVGNFDSTGLQRVGPSCVRGEGHGSRILASGNMTGVMMLAKNLVAVRFSGFMLDGNGYADLMWLNTTWEGVGPHQLNVYEDLILHGLNLNAEPNGDNPRVGHSARNNNQSIWRNVTYRSIGDGTGVSLDMEGSGGSYYIYDITCEGTLRMTCQNASVVGGSFHGFEFGVAQTGHNAVAFVGAQIYSNPRSNACFWTGLPGTVSSLSFDGCLFPLIDPDHAVFDLSLISEIRLTNTIVAPPRNSADPTDLKLLGDNFTIAAPGADNAKLLLRGGQTEHPGRLVHRPVERLAIGKENFANYGGMLENQSAADRTVTLTGPFADGSAKPLLPAGALPAGSYLATISYDHKGGGAPYVVQGAILFAVGLVNYAGADQIQRGNFSSHLGGDSKFDIGLTPATSLTSGLHLIPNFTNTDPAQRVVVQLSRLNAT